MQKDIFDIEGLFRYYSKTILKESARQPLMENEIMVDLNNPGTKIKDAALVKRMRMENPKRFKTILYYDDDPNIIPTSFQLNFIYRLEFNLNNIKKEYSKNQLDVDKNIDIGDDEIERMIAQQLKNKPQKVKSAKKVVVDIENFYHDVFKKNLPSYILNGKINDLIRAGVIPIDDYKIFAITYSTQVDDKLLFRKLESDIKKNIPVSHSPYGYEIAFQSKDKRQAKTIQEVVDFSLRFTKAFGNSILKDTQYYKIRRK